MARRGRRKRSVRRVARRAYKGAKPRGVWADALMGVGGGEATEGIIRAVGVNLGGIERFIPYGVAWLTGGVPGALAYTILNGLPRFGKGAENIGEVI